MTSHLPSTPPAPSPLLEVVLPIDRMSCATCVNRIERFLNRADGVETATVNLATERAAVRYDPARIDRAGIVGAIEAAGYDVRGDAVRSGAGARETATDAEAAVEAARAAERSALLRDGVAATAIGLAMMVATLLPGLPLTVAQLNLVLLVPATVVQLVLGRRFTSRALRGLVHGELTMDTLVAMGTWAAYLYSAVIALAPGLATNAGLPLDTFFETAAIIIGLVLIGRWLEARARGEASSAVRAPPT
jgi:Cu+-exporting ATPase